MNFRKKVATRVSIPTLKKMEMLKAVLHSPESKNKTTHDVGEVLLVAGISGCNSQGRISMNNSQGTEVEEAACFNYTQTKYGNQSFEHPDRES